MPNKYLELKKKQQDEFDEFPIIFAFNNKQLEEGMKKLDVKDKSELFSVFGGGYIRKTDSGKLKDLWVKQSEEMEKAVKEDETGEGFIYEMFRYELDNHEYGYTMDFDPALESLGISYEKIQKNEALRRGFSLALKGY